MADSGQVAARIGARLARVRRHHHKALDAALKASDLPPLAWSEILFDLARRPEGRSVPGAIERRLVLEQYNLSRLVDRLEAKALVRRVPHPTDRRRQYIEITEEGRRLRDLAWPVYINTLRTLTEPLSAKQAAKLADLLDRLLDGRGRKKLTTPSSAEQDA